MCVYVYIYTYTHFIEHICRYHEGLLSVDLFAHVVMQATSRKLRNHTSGTVECVVRPVTLKFKVQLGHGSF